MSRPPGMPTNDIDKLVGPPAVEAAEAAPQTPSESPSEPVSGQDEPANSPAPVGPAVPRRPTQYAVMGASSDPKYLASLLPRSKTMPDLDFSGSIVLIYGPPKIGKSDLASQFPGALFLATEEGHKHLHIYRTSITSWQHYLDTVQALIAYTAQGAELPYKTIVIDTVDILFDFCSNHFCMDKGIQHPSDEGFGKGWSGLKAEWSKGIYALIKLGYTVIFISHKAQRKATLHGIERDIISPSYSGSAGKIITPSVDYIVYLDYCSKEESIDGRKMVLRGSDTIEAGDRSGFFTPEIYEISYKALHEDYVLNVLPKMKAKYNLGE